MFLLLQHRKSKGFRWLIRSANKRTYYGIRNMSDRLCREHGLSVVVPGRGSKGKSYAEFQAEKTGTSWKGKLKIAVDALIPQASDFADFLRLLQAAGYEIKPGKYICREGRRKGGWR